VLHFYGGQPALEFFTGYLLEKALSVDNLFLFLVIFRAFAVDDRLQHRLLEWGVVGALVMRGVMIALGAELIEQFSWVMYLLGAFLVYAGLRMLFFNKGEIHPEQSKIFRFASRRLRVSREYHGEHFFVRNGGKLFATPLFLVLLVVEITDVTLAVDSIPAVFGITRDPFIVYTSNVLAILGLRSLYFLLAGVIDRLRFLDEGLAVVLVFIGGKNGRRALAAHSGERVSWRCGRRTADLAPGVTTHSAKEKNLRLILPQTSVHQCSTTSSFRPAPATGQSGA